MVYFVSLILFSILAGIVSVIFQIPFWVVIAIIVVIGIGRLGYILYMTYRSKDLVKLERYLASSTRNPLNQYILTQKDGDVKTQMAAIDALLARYSSPVVQGTYKASRAMLVKDYKAAREAAATIPNIAMKNYSLALIEATIGKKNNIAEYTLAKPWMQSLIEAIISYREGDLKNYELHKNASLEKTSGIQYFSNYYFFERIQEHVSKK
ncbi:MAG: hypothetical protein ACI33M_03985 [Lysinibacillus sp.]